MLEQKTDLENAYDSLRLIRDRLLAETDWIVMRSAEKGIPVPKPWQDYRQALRDFPATADVQLNRFDHLDEKILNWPTKPTE